MYRVQPVRRLAVVLPEAWVPRMWRKAPPRVVGRAARVVVGSKAAYSRSAAALERFRWAIPFVALAGAVVCAGLVLRVFLLGGWPMHDTADFWLAGRHFLEGTPIYGTDPQGYLVFIYAPPWAILWAPISLLSLEVVCGLNLGLQLLALRYVAGSWVAAGLFCWLPVVSGEFTTGNVDFLMAAAILMAIRGRTWPAVLFAFAKFSPAFVLIRASRRGWKAAIATGLILVAITLPWIELWPQWVALMLAVPAGVESVVPLLVRVPLALVLGGIPRPWALAAAAGLLTPSFHEHTWVVLIPAVRLLWDTRLSLASMKALTPVDRLSSGARGAVQVASPAEVGDHRGERQWQVEQ